VRLAEAVTGLHPRPAMRGSFARPGPKPAQGLRDALMKRIVE